MLPAIFGSTGGSLEYSLDIGLATTVLTYSDAYYETLKSLAPATLGSPVSAANMVLKLSNLCTKMYAKASHEERELRDIETLGMMRHLLRVNAMRAEALTEARKVTVKSI